ncbi:MAG TPA: Tim44 domain-containing protein [Geobacteraceae bacterium]|nr:Tim44 domain-containing protein [Geobacteraceae bacterium]
MKRDIFKLTLVVTSVLFLMVGIIASDAFARAGSSRSIGSRGSRSYSQPASPYSQPARPQVAPQPSPTTPPPYQPQPAGGGFFRNMAGGILGGMLGGMLFRSLGFGGGGMGGSGIGLFEILLIAGIGYMIYRMVKKRREEASSPNVYEQGGYQQSYASPQQGFAQSGQPETADVDTGLAHIRQMDASFDENRFNDSVMDMFFKIQGAWMNRDLAPVGGILTDEMRRIFQGDIDGLLREKRVNRLENIAVRNVEIVEAWQESGQDFITALIYANLLDYTTDDATGQVVAGSKTDPVKFEEYWTFTRPVGNNPWKLSAINQK